MIVIVVVLVVVVLIVAIAAVLYIMVSGLIGGPPSPRLLGVTISASGNGANWTVLFSSVPSGLMPATTFLLIRDVQGVISLHQTSFSSLTYATDRATYQDASPAVPEVRIGDALLIDRATYMSGSTMQISEAAGVLCTRTL